MAVEENAVQAGVYRHYKGGRYLVMGVALHTEDESLMVVYTRLYRRRGPAMFVRPLPMFLGTVVVDGQEIRRFRFIGSEDDGEGLQSVE